MAIVQAYTVKNFFAKSGSLNFSNFSKKNSAKNSNGIKRNVITALESRIFTKEYATNAIWSSKAGGKSCGDKIPPISMLEIAKGKRYKKNINSNIVKYVAVMEL